MGFLGFIVMFIMAAMVIIAVTMIIIGTNLTTIGITGLLMDNIYKKQMNGKWGKLKKIYNIIAIVVGAILVLIPTIFILYSALVIIIGS